MSPWAITGIFLLVFVALKVTMKRVWKQKGMTALLAWCLLVILGLTLTFTKSWKPLLGLDLQGGVSVTLKPKKLPKGQTYSTGQIEIAKEIIASRVNGLGVGEPDIVRSNDTVVVQLPGLKTAADRQRALDLIGKTGRLTFRPVLSVAGPPTPSTTTVPGKTSTTVKGATSTTLKGSTPTTAAGSATTKAGNTKQSSLAPRGTGGARAVRPVAFAAGGSPAATTAPPTTAPGATPTTVATATTLKGATPTTLASKTPTATPTCGDEKFDGTDVLCIDPKTHLRYVLGPVKLEGTAVSHADASVDQGQWQVNVTIKTGKQTDANALYNACADGQSSGAIICPSQGGSSGQVAVVLDGVVANAAGVQARDLATNGFKISPFSHREASDLALELRYGSLPVQFAPANVEQVSATLGTSSLHAGLIAGAVGLGLVALYVLLFYRLLGAVAILSLATGSALLWTVISYLGVHSGLALTLSGITGIIVSIGVAVDSNVVFYEHLREDIAKGRSFRATVNASFESAWHTIVIADVVSLIGAGILYFFTLGSVRGFAFYLGLSTILDLGASWFFMRPVVLWMARSDRFVGHSNWLGVRAPRAARAPADVVAGVEA